MQKFPRTQFTIESPTVLKGSIDSKICNRSELNLVRLSLYDYFFWALAFIGTTIFNFYKVQYMGPFCPLLLLLLLLLLLQAASHS